VRRAAFHRRLRAAVLFAVLVCVLPWGAVAKAQSIVTPALAAKIAAAPAERVDVLVGLQGRAGAADVADVRARGVTPLRVFEEFGVIYGVGSGRDVLRLASLPRAVSLSENARIHFQGDTDIVASRARDAWDAKTGATPAKVGSTIINGAGVGVAVVDSGIDGDNPDLAAALKTNKKFVCTTGADVIVYTPTNTCAGNALIGNVLEGTPYTGCTNDLWLDLSDTDTTGGHGTHVAGIVAGRGTASDGRFMGSAPAASLYGFGSGDYNTILFALESFNWISCNHALVSPRIRVVNNSWSPDPAPYNPNDVISKAVDVLVSKGIVVVFSASNDGGTGSQDNINPYAKSPTKGVLNVANYNDDRRATRAGQLNSSSSRGKSSDTNPNNWPDVAAPGTSIVSTGARSGTYLPTGFGAPYLPWYTSASGTSMSAPHVAGVCALLLQAKPSLTPADVEDILEDHAVPFATPGGYVSDSTNPTSGTNFGAGHGLIDAIASLQDPRVGALGGSSLPRVSQNPHVGVAGVDAQLVRGVQWTYPAATELSLSEIALRSGDAVTSPLSAGQGAVFRVFPASGSAFSIPAVVTAGISGGEHTMSATHAFAAGTYRIESQINFGSGFRPIDSWVLRIV
jgi:serine protease AprX